jgi:hypothetical protein
MKKLRYLRAAIALATTVVAVGVLGGAASASAPTITPIHDTFRFTSDLCSFPVQVIERAQGLDMQYFDAQGNPTREVVHLMLSGTWTNATSETYLVERSRVTNVLPEAGGFSEIGLNFHLRLPNGRTVLIDAGKLVIDDGEVVFEAGKHQVEDGHLAAFCAALR